MRTLCLHKAAEKYLSKLNNGTAERIEDAMINLCHMPPIGDISPLKGKPPFWRLREGNYRIIFYIKETRVNVIDIGPRGKIYKRGEWK